MENEATMGQVVPFARSAEYLRRLALKQREQGMHVKALELFRMSLLKAPDDAQTIMEIAETYALMQCPTLSNQALFSLLQNEKVAPECLYGAGCNFYAVQMLDCARDCLVLYLKQRPDGPYAAEAVEIIESIDEELPEESPVEAKINRRIERVLDSMDSGRPELAARQVRRVLSVEKRNGGARALLAFALLKSGDAKGALEAARYAMRCNRGDIRALCALAASLKANGSDDIADIFLAKAARRIENDEDTQLVCQTACEMGAHARVLQMLERLCADMPFADDLLHMLAVASHNVGDPEEAVRIWKLLRRVNPMDSVAEYRLEMAEMHALPGTLPYDRQVPLGETLIRLGRLREWVQEGAGAILDRWRADDTLEKMLRWGLASDEPGVPEAMMGILATIGDSRAKSVLLDMLPDMEAPDERKHEALASLCAMGENGPFYALVGGRLTLVHIAKSEPGAPDPHLQALVETVRRHVAPRSKAEEALIKRLCEIAYRQPGATRAGFCARAVEFAFAGLRGKDVRPAARPVKRRKLERLARSIMKEAIKGEADQL